MCIIYPLNMVWGTGFEPATSSFQVRSSDQTEPPPDYLVTIVGVTVDSRMATLDASLVRCDPQGL